MIIEKPLKRNINIQPLSRDHHFGLLFCWKIRIALRHQIAPERMIRYLDYFWKGHLKRHFKEEEELLFNKVAHAICEQGKDEHIQLEQLITWLLTDQVGNIPEELERLINLLNAHIRFEERILFPFLERHLSEKELSEIGEYLDKEDEYEFADNYGDEFWIIPR